MSLNITLTPQFPCAYKMCKTKPFSSNLHYRRSGWSTLTVVVEAAVRQSVSWISKYQYLRYCTVVWCISVNNMPDTTQRMFASFHFQRMQLTDVILLLVTHKKLPLVQISTVCLLIDEKSVFNTTQFISVGIWKPAWNKRQICATVFHYQCMDEDHWWLFARSRLLPPLLDSGKNLTFLVTVLPILLCACNVPSLFYKDMLY